MSNTALILSAIAVCFTMLASVVALVKWGSTQAATLSVSVVSLKESIDKLGERVEKGLETGQENAVEIARLDARVINLEKTKR